MKSLRIHLRLVSLALLVGGFLAGFPQLARADIKLPSIISDHMILQRSSHTSVWGKAAPSEKISLTLGDVRGQAVAGPDGNWKIVLDLSQSKEGPFDMVVEGVNKITVADVLVGEVWLCSGESNLVFSLARSTGGAEEAARSTNPRIRQFTVAYNPITEPQDQCKGAWMVADPTNSPGFTAIGYYFAKDLQKALKVPVGIVRSAWAGTVIRHWLSEAAFCAEPGLKEMSDLTMQQFADYPKLKKAYPPAILDWETKNNRKDRPADPATFAAPGIDESDWVKVAHLNSPFKAMGLPDAGAVWFRKKVILPSNISQNPFISLIVHSFDQTYLNGKKLGEITEATSLGLDTLRIYKIPPDAYKVGENILAIRVFTPTEAAAFGSAKIDVGLTTINLPGEWLAKTEFELPPLAAKDYPQLPKDPGMRPGALYNGMINPLTPCTFAGVVWYQGANDLGRTGSQYNLMLKTLIGDWRARFGSQLHFALCQLTNTGKKTSSLGSSNWANIREAQRRALDVPGTSLVNFIDLGEEDVHAPDNRKTAGERVALSALANVYGQKNPYSGPIYDSMKVDGNKAVISFRFVESGLVARPLPSDYLPTYSAKEKIPLVRNSPESELEGFSICGEENKWVWAQAKVDGETVIVWAPSVTKPVAVRYAWADNPTCNLYNSAGLPASPFQTGELK